MNKEQTLYHGRIITDPDILVGKPVVEGTRISVELVREYLTHTPDLDELFADYPEPTREDVQAVLAHAQAAIGRERLLRLLPGPDGARRARLLSRS